MPGWTPPPELHFDHGAAQHAAAEVSHTLLSVRSIIAAVEPALERARARWAGRARELADEWLDRHLWALHDAIDELCRLLDELHRAADDAAVEQRRRSGLQEEWTSQERSERRAAAGLDLPDARAGRSTPMGRR